MKISPNHLVAVAAIDELGGLTASARHLNTSQAALSRLVSNLEARLEAPLFDKSVRPRSLTPLGAILVHEGRVIEMAQATVSRSIEQFNTGEEGTIRVGGTPFFVDAIIAGIIASFQKIHTRVRFDQSYGYPDTLISSMRLGKIDIAICPIDILDENLQLTFAPLLRARNVVACRESHPLAGQAIEDPEVLLDYPWIVPPPGSPLNQDLRASLARLELGRLRIAYSGGTLAGVTNHLKASDSLTILPHSVVFAMRGSGISAIQIELEAPTRTLGMLLPVRRQSKAIENFIQHLTSTFDQLSGQIRRHEEIVIWGN